MDFLKPDAVRSVPIGTDSILIKEKIIPDGARASKYVADYVRKGDLMKPCIPLSDGVGRPRGITVHNTGDIAVADGTNPAEQYTRATWPNCNMGGAVVHFYIYRSEIWQNLSEQEQGWHAADGSTRRDSQRPGKTIGGNRDTIAVESIGDIEESEDTTAKLVAYLLCRYDLSPETDVYTHQFFYPGKNCPAYILPHWPQFLERVKRYVAAIREPDGAPAPAPKPAPVAPMTVKVGSVVRLKSEAKTYTGGGLASFVYNRDHVVSELSGDRAVITFGGTVVAAVHVEDLVTVNNV